MKISFFKTSVLKWFKPFANAMRRAVLLPFIMLRKALNLIASISTRSARTINLFITAAKQIPAKPINNIEALRLPIVDKHEVGELIKTIIVEHVESTFFPKVYGLSDGGRMEFNFPKIELLKYHNATVFPFSDFIITANVVVWEKFHQSTFTKTIPLDKDLIKIDNNYLIIKRPGNSKRVNVGYSLCGVHCTIWSHFLVQYLPKLYLIVDLRKTLDQNITVILPDYTDHQIREIVFSFINKSEGIEILELQHNEVAICDALYHVEKTALLSDHGFYVSPADIIIPEFVAHSLKNNLLTDFFYNSKDKNEQNFELKRKIYITRNGYRNISNAIEIEEFFRQKDFLFISPQTLTLQEKIRLFNQADIVVGPASSGFTNLIFSRPDTTVLVFINFQRCFESYFGFISKYFGIDFTMITGHDESSDIHTTYSVPLSKINTACLAQGI